MKLMGKAEVEKLTGIHNFQITRWMESGKFPEPVARLKCGPIWLEVDVKRWCKRR